MQISIGIKIKAMQLKDVDQEEMLGEKEQRDHHSPISQMSIVSFCLNIL